MMLPPLVLVLMGGVLGLMIGSFLNVCIARLPAGESVVTPGSRCPSCRASIPWFDNVPVLSYLRLGGRCRTCRAAISPRYLAVELLTGLVFALQVWLLPEPGVQLASRLVFTALLVALAGTDLETYRLPNPLTLGGLVAGLAFSLTTDPGPVAAVTGALVGAAVLLAIRWGWRRATGTDGMGLGDVKMLAMVGAFLGPAQVGVVLFLSTLVGALVGVVFTVVGRGGMRSRLPFGVFLALSAFVASLVGHRLLEWYLGLMRV
jgi:leader peptidase (prepilin peptidase)/N-methyltransferase